MVFQWFWGLATIDNNGFQWLCTIGSMIVWLATIVEVYWESLWWWKDGVGTSKKRYPTTFDIKLPSNLRQFLNLENVFLRIGKKLKQRELTKKLFYDIEIHLMSQEQWNAFANLTMKMIAIMLIQSIIIHDCIDEQTITGIATIMIVVISILAFSWSWWHCTCC